MLLSADAWCHRYQENAPSATKRASPFTYVQMYSGKGVRATLTPDLSFPDRQPETLVMPNHPTRALNTSLQNNARSVFGQPLPGSASLSSRCLHEDHHRRALHLPTWPGTQPLHDSRVFDSRMSQAASDDIYRQTSEYFSALPNEVRDTRHEKRPNKSP